MVRSLIKMKFRRSNPRSEFITNYIIQTETKTVFWNSKAWKEEKHTGENIAKDISCVIEEFGSEKVCLFFFEFYN